MPPRRPPPLPAPGLAGGEIVALDLSDADLATPWTAAGYGVIETRAVPGLGATARRLRVPQGTALAAGRDFVRTLLRTGRGFQPFLPTPRSRLRPGLPRCRLLGAAEHRLAAGGVASGRLRQASIGMVDTGINETSSGLRGAQIEIHRRADAGLDPSRGRPCDRGGRAAGRRPATRARRAGAGRARLVAVDAFHRAGSDERADAFTLVDALGFLAAQEVGVINLSLAGPPNTVLEAVVTRSTTEADIVLVSAAGNGGPSAGPFFPAAYGPVIAVTATSTAAAMPIAAPGRDRISIWPRPESTTPGPPHGRRRALEDRHLVRGAFVSPQALLREARLDLSAGAIAEELRRTAIDLGAPGPDPVRRRPPGPWRAVPEPVPQSPA